MNSRNGVLGLILILISFFSPCLAAEDTCHIVVSGDTVFSIARSYGVARDELIRINEIADPSKLRVGQRLLIRRDTGNDEFYQAEKGDTFYAIARKYGVTVDEILEANSLTAGYILRQGDMLQIPGRGGEDVSAVPLPPSAPVMTNPAPEAGTDQGAAEIPVQWPIAARELSYISESGRASGVLITGGRSESIKSLTSGTIISAGPYRGYGRVAIVQAPDGYVYVYGGCETLTVKEGDKVGPGMEMGRLGIDPISQKPQLFFRVYLNNTPVDPALAPRA